MCFVNACIPGVPKGERTEGRGTRKREALLPAIGVGHTCLFWDTSRHLSSASRRTVKAEKFIFLSLLIATIYHIKEITSHRETPSEDSYPELCFIPVGTRRSLVTPGLASQPLEGAF